AGGGVAHIVQQAAGLVQDGDTLVIRVALAKHAVEDLARIAFQRQGLAAGTIVDRTAGFAAQLQGRQRRGAADLARRDLVDGDAGLRSARTVLRVRAGQPGLLDDAVRIGAFAALVAQAADHRDVFV